MSMLEVKDLNVSYGAIKALRGINFEVNEGEVITLSVYTTRRAILGYIALL